MWRGVALAATIVFLSGTSGGVAQENVWDKVVAAAKQEGRVTFYTSRVGSPFHRDVLKAFEKKYGIRVDLLEARGNELSEKIRTEKVSGHIVGDLTQNGALIMIPEARRGDFQAYGQLPNAERFAPPFASTDMLVPVFAMSSGILVNTNLVPQDQEPKSWMDLLDPRWRGKILSDDPRVPGSAFTFAFVMQEKFGRGFLEKLSAQKLTFSQDLGNDMRRVARGEYAVYIPLLLPEYPALKGLPVKAIAPAEGSPYSVFSLGIVKDAPHPNAARLLMNFFLEPDSQLIYARGGNTPVITGLPDDGISELVKPVKLMGTVDVDRRDEAVKLFKEVFSK